MQPKAILFDAYGTLLDVHSPVRRAAEGIPGDHTALSALWRRKQLEYTWLRALMERYEGFRQITEAALRNAAAELSIDATEEQLARLMQAYMEPEIFPDVEPALDALSALPLGILSNGSPDMLDAAVRFNRLERYLTHLISVDGLRTYKPSPRVYALGPERLGLPASDILFVSSNAWDAAGAKAFGYTVCWCNRTGAKPDNLGFAPDLVVAALDGLANFYRFV